jgi:hypothetical protein
MPHLPLVYSRILRASGLCLSSRMAASVGAVGPSRIFGGRDISADVGAIGQLVTHIVSLCAREFCVPTWSGHPRQDVGRYFELMVLGVHTQVILPA